MSVDVESIVQALMNLGGRAKAKDISPEVAKVLNKEPYPPSYKDYRSFYGTVQATIERYCPESENYKSGTKQIFSRVGHGIYELLEKKSDALKKDTELNNNEKTTSVEYFSIDNIQAIEGYKKDRKILSSHRNQSLANERKRLDNYTCQACGFILNISGTFVIECHHLKPLSESDAINTTINDIVTLCPTCHRIAHLRKPPYTPKEIENIIKKT